ncbi:MAG TPA: metallophosphoesterase [Bacteroidales bacterium]|jgi:3',5'-cyclic AMP phosphodiesterase CpdA|nr:metallophosphoesterase [Bacteroidales bacterium]
MKKLKRIWLGIGFFLVFLYNLDAQKPTEKFSFVFMTDIHITKDYHAEEGFRKALGRAMELEPDFIITGGDLVMDALDCDYQQALEQYDLYLGTISNLPIPVYNTMGNHEIWGWQDKSLHQEEWEDYGKNLFKRRIGQPNYSFDHKGWHFIVIDGIEYNDSTGYIGWASDETLSFIKNDLRKVDPKIPIILITHIPLITLEAQLEKGALAGNHPMEVIGNSKEVLECFSTHRLSLVLQGHLHYYEKMEIIGISFITGGAVSGAWWKGNYRGTEEGFVLIQINGEYYKTEYIDYGWEVTK